MKFKFIAETKDIVIFIIYCIALLYFVAIAILNVNYFATVGEPWGLNPIPAFGSEFLFLMKKWMRTATTACWKAN